MGPIRLINSRPFRPSDILGPRRFDRLTQPKSTMSILLHVLLIAVQVVVLVGLADFVAGLVHWAEDAYFDEKTPVIGRRIIVPNIVHHHVPRYFTRLSWWQSSADLLFVALVTLAIACPLGWVSWQLLLFLAVSVNANHVHKLAHRTRA